MDEAGRSLGGGRGGDARTAAAVEITVRVRAPWPIANPVPTRLSGHQPRYSTRDHSGVDEPFPFRVVVE
jgi:hypothetical protein